MEDLQSETLSGNTLTVDQKSDTGKSPASNNPLK